MSNLKTTNTQTLNIQVNDQHRAVPQGTSIQQLLDSLDLRGGPVAVELNLEIVPSGQIRDTLLREGDQLEIVSLTGGG